MRLAVDVGIYSMRDPDFDDVVANILGDTGEPVD